ncbi:MAG: flagellar hook-associated protein FlgK [Planctomycetaceae bacterium]|nr:MAG: flagellar hook-associated protein FlgK [Planctomycetaceae bacterium]
MDSFGIGISGLNAAQRAFDIIGNNIANAATDGYHRQRLNLTPAYSSQIGPVILGGGVDIAGITRIIDGFLEKEIIRQQSSLEQVSQELAMLRTVENSFGELSDGGGLSTALDDFFNALQDLSAHPAETIWQNQAVTSTQTMAAKFNTLGQFLTTLESQIPLEAENVVNQINDLTGTIAELNHNINKQEISSGQAYNLRDQRDQCITELSKLINVETESREYGVVDISTNEIPLVVSTSALELEVGITENLELGITAAGRSNYNTDVQGGRLGALVSLKNDLIAGIQNDLDNLANAIIQQINQYHVQGVGSEGSFTSLTGWVNESGDLSDFSTVAVGYTYIRVTNTSTGAVTRTQIDVNQDAASDTLTEIAGFINGAGVANVTASVNSSNQLTISADTGYKFDFLPAVLPTATTDFAEALPPNVTVSGIYTGTSNDTLTFTVSGDGSVGNDDSLQLIVTDSTGTIATVNIGSGYAVGDEITIGDTGIKIALSIGDLNQTIEDDKFTVQVFGNTDTSGLLSAVGINTFFSGSNAQNIAVCADITANPKRVATALGEDMTDNNNALRIAALRDQAVSDLDSLTPGEYYRRLITDIGQQVSVKQLHQKNVEVMVQNLASQQSEISGVNINDEAARMLIFEQMFKAMAKYLSTLQSSLSTIMEII